MRAPLWGSLDSLLDSPLLLLLAGGSSSGVGSLMIECSGVGRRLMSEVVEELDVDDSDRSGPVAVVVLPPDFGIVVVVVFNLLLAQKSKVAEK